MKDLVLPLTGGNNRCIRDATGAVVSIYEHAEEFAHTMNHHRTLMKQLRATIEPLKVGRAFLRPESPAYSNMTRCINQVEKAIASAEQVKLPEPAPEATADELTDAMGRIHDQDTTMLDFAKEILKHYRVVAR